MNPSPIRIMIDMESTDTCARAGILTLGACTFGQPFGATRETFYSKASLASNEQLKRSINPETIAWWDKQDKSIRNEAFGGTGSVDDLLDNFATWCSHWVAGPAFSGVDKDLTKIELWSRGAGFDCEILQDAFLQIFGYYPFDFRKHMCQRTLQALMPEWLVKAVPQRAAKHVAYIDAYNQADIIDVALRNLSWHSAIGMQQR